MAEPNPKPTRPTSDHSDEDAYRIAPLDPTPEDERFERPVIPEVVVEDESPHEEIKLNRRFQFTLRDMLLLMTGVAVWLAAMSTFSFSWPIAAGLMGMAAFVSLIVLTIAEPENPSVRFAWWCILGVYMLTCLCAILIG